ncbi:Dephospho-CoA kinase CAB5 [Candida viswanathii]|uniref:Dephospho-CoA kinase CAB5 n=1 Tax=Candida viswanathii TaxID=5486 RepID=A0A367YHY2_9ASCO|nr:Dephospho-CoA kinase CAB5 [Candida viswanathii]
MLIVGLTGGIACGKSTVSKELKEKYHLTVVDADLIAREVVYPNKPAFKKIVAAFGQDVPDLVNPQDGSLNRPALGKAVFGNKDKLATLNAIVHPAVKWEMFRQILIAYITLKQLIVLDVPLLYESGLSLICGLTVTISCTKEIQVERLLARNPELSVTDVTKRIDSQMSNDERNYRSDIVIDNSGDLNTLYESIKSLVHEIKPNLIWYLLDLFPPFAILSALFTFTIRRISDKFIGTRKPKVE